MSLFGNKFKIFLVSAAFILLTLTILGITSLLTAGEFVPGLTLSLFSGMSMIFLPCTFPLVFVIVPLALSGKRVKGLVMALLFGLGLTLAFTLYGIITGWVGGYVGLSKIIRVMLLLGGITSIIFGLSELKLIKFKLPFKQTILPPALQKKGDYVRSFLLGFFLGNAGVGCPNPAFYILFGYVATIGQVGPGAYLGALHGIGRLIPLLLITVLALLGVNATKTLAKYQGRATRAVGWSLVALGAFILNYGLFSHTWFEESVIHVAWNRFIELVAPRAAESQAIERSLNLPEGLTGPGPWLLLGGIIGAVIIWDIIKIQRGKQKNV